jgi:hypothetical protein
MPEPRFVRFEHKLDVVVGRGTVLERRVDALCVEVEKIKVDIEVLKADVAQLKVDVAELKTDVAQLKIDVCELRHHMGVLHEETLDRIRSLGEHDALRAEMRAGFASVLCAFREHTVPGDAADRQFASQLADHERRIQTLEAAE